MRTAGEILKEERTKKGVSLEEVETATKIRKKTLSALESGDWGSVPPTFIKGLLKNYADFLGIDEKRVLAFFRREYDEKKSTNPKLFSSEKRKFYLTPTFVSISLISILVIAVSWYLFSQYQSFTAAPKLEIAEPSDNTKTTSKEVNVIGQTWSDAQVKINGEMVQVSPGGTFSVSVGLKEGVNVLVISSANKFGKITTAKRTIVVETLTQEKNVLAEKNKLLSLDLEIINNSTFVTVDVDGREVFDGLMVTGSVTSFEAKENIKIRTKNAGNTKVVVDGQEMILGKEGEAIEREFTP